MNPSSTEEAAHLYKVLFIGYTEGFFTPNYKLTIGVDFAVKEIFWDTNTQISLQLWDVAGHER
jgi:Ras-related protein Rab-32